MSPQDSLGVMLSDGDRRSIGRANEVVDLVLVQPETADALVQLSWDSSEVVRMRAADALEKIARYRIDLLQAYKSELLGLMAETSQQELRWHLAAMIPRMYLTPEEY